MPAKTPQQMAGIERLRAWAVGPQGQAHFRWGSSGDFDRCRRFYATKLPPQMLDGWCANLHKLATGASPGHAPAEEAMKMAKGH